MIMQSRFPGKCVHCGTPFAEGEEIDYIKGEGAYLPGHRDDVKPSSDDMKSMRELANRLGYK